MTKLRGPFSCQGTSLEPYFCKSCDFEAEIQFVLFRHQKQEHRVNPRIDHRVSFNNHICAKCSFQTYSSLHFLKHSSNSCHPVANNLKYSSTEHNLIHEMKEKLSHKLHRTWPEERNFKCKKCSYEAKLKQHLQEHVLFKHTTDAEIQWVHCDQCTYKCKRGVDLKRHVMKHDKKLFTDWLKCDECAFETKLLANLKQHKLETHSTPETLMRFRCDKCPYEAKWRSRLRVHVVRKHGAGND